MLFALRNHQNKGAALLAALTAAGHEQVGLNAAADVLLVDHDAPINGYRELIDQHKQWGAKVVIIPHGANVPMQWDGIWEPHPQVDLCMTIAHGHRKIMRRYGYPHPIEVIGWYYSQQRPFQARAGKRVLFAPMHPDGHDELPEPERVANLRIFEELRRLGYEITVRYLGSLQANGLPLVDGVTYKRGQYDNSYSDILNTDCVVTTGTYGFHAVALGVPMVTFWQQLGTVEAQGTGPAHWHEYAADLQYPLDADDDIPLNELIDMAQSSNALTEQWRGQFIGEQFDPEKFVMLIEGIVNA